MSAESAVIIGLRLTNTKRCRADTGDDTRSTAELERIMDDTMLGVGGLVFLDHNWVPLDEDLVVNRWWCKGQGVRGQWSYHDGLGCLVRHCGSCSRYWKNKNEG